MTDITTVSKRESPMVKVRREPHWHKVGEGLYLGFRKTSATTGTWIARRYVPKTEKKEYTSFGELLEHESGRRFARAADLARAWAGHIAAGGSRENITVSELCRRFTEAIARQGNADKAIDHSERLARLLPLSRLGDVTLQDLNARDVKNWRSELERLPALVTRRKAGNQTTRPRSRATINRDIVPLRAALNYGLDEGYLVSDVVWRKSLKPFKNAGQRKDIYLDRQQRKALIAELGGDIKIFANALNVLPLRPGAIAKLTVADHDARTKELRIKYDKAGRDRRIPLPDATNDFLSQVAAGRTGSQPMFVRSNGEAWNKDSWKKPFRAAAQTAALPAGVTAYTLRHSTITDLVGQGLDLLAVAQISGTSVAMIEKYYGHLQRKHAVAALATLV